jgi:CheY-like chemotaxis protein
MDSRGVCVSDSDPTLVVLVVDDDPADIILIKDALESVVDRPDVHFAEDGVQALQNLRGSGLFRAAAAPDLILLDLNMPGKDGRETLVEIKADEMLATIPVIVLSTSQSREDIDSSYLAGANAYVIKPIDRDGLLVVISQIVDMFTRLATLPSRLPFAS